MHMAMQTLGDRVSHDDAGLAHTHGHPHAVINPWDRAATRQHPPTRLGLLLQEAAADGLDAEQVLEGTGLTAAAVSDPFTLISCRQFMRAVRNAVQLGASDDLGLRVGQRLRVSNYGLYGYALLCSESVRHMWDRAIAYHPLSGGLLPLRWAQQGDDAVWTFPDRADMPWPDLDERLWQVLVDLQLAAHVTIGRDVMGGWFVPSRVTLSSTSVPHQARIEAALQCPVMTGQAANTLVFPVAWLSREPLLANPVTASHVSQQCARLLADMQWTSTTSRRVYEALTQRPGHFPDIEAVAATLCMTSRTLRRHLEAEGTSFSELLMAVRKALAIDYLRATRMSAEDIAEALGFSEVTSFRHAFKRWTGVSPSAFRSLRD